MNKKWKQNLVLSPIPIQAIYTVLPGVFDTMRADLSTRTYRWWGYMAAIAGCIALVFIGIKDQLEKRGVTEVKADYEPLLEIEPVVVVATIVVGLIVIVISFIRAGPGRYP